jgi:hypothetical protein
MILVIFWEFTDNFIVFVVELPFLSLFIRIYLTLVERCPETRYQPSPHPTLLVSLFSLLCLWSCAPFGCSLRSAVILIQTGSLLLQPTPFHH